MSSAYLSREWLDAASASLAAADLSELGPGDRIRFGYTITDVPPSLGSIRYTITLDPAVPEASLTVDDGGGDVRFTMSYTIAQAIASGLQNGSKAFLNGEVQLGGHVQLLIGRSQDLALLDGLMPPVMNTHTASSSEG